MAWRFISRWLDRNTSYLSGAGAFFRQSPRRSHRRRFSASAQQLSLEAITEVLEDRTLLATIVIDDDGSGDFTSIQAAIDHINTMAGDILQITGGADRIHTEPGILVNKNLTIEGTPGATQVIVQAHAQPGMATDRVFSIPSGTIAAIDNLVIRHGVRPNVDDFDEESGGGIQNAGTLTLTNATVTANSANFNGGGLFNFGGVMNLSNVIVSGNSATNDGGGVSNQGASFTVNAFLHITNCLIMGNTTRDGGGGIASDDGTVNVIGSTISNNVAGNAFFVLDGGGGILIEFGELHVVDSLISNNSTFRSGGGIQNTFSDVTVINSTLSGNSAARLGGGIHIDFESSSGSITAVTNSTILNNLANLGGGIFNIDTNPDHFLLNNSIIGGSRGGELVGLYSGSTNIVQDGSGTGLSNTIEADPRLGPLQDNGGNTLTHAPLGDSPALNAGQDSLAVDVNSNPLTTDQRGFERFIGTVDIGAVEASNVTLVVEADQASLSEGTGDETDVTFSVTLFGNPVGTTTVDYLVVGTDVEADDFVGDAFPTGTLTFAPGETQKTITIKVKADSQVETVETFEVKLVNPSLNVLIDPRRALTTILNDDSATLTLTGSNAVQQEGSGPGRTAFTFSVTLDNAVDGGLNVGFTTNDLTATTADNDYLDNDGRLAFVGTAGEVQTIAVQVNHDSKVEIDEVFQVVLGSIGGLGLGIDPGNVTIANGTQDGVVQNDDTATLILAGVNSSRLEGTGVNQFTEFEFSVTLDQPVVGGFQVAYFTNDGPLEPSPDLGIAVEGEDYQDNDGVIQFAGNASERHLIKVQVNADAKVEATELFHVVLGAITNLSGGINPASVKLSDSLNDRQQVGTILNSTPDGQTDDTTQVSLTNQGESPPLLAPAGPFVVSETQMNGSLRRMLRFDIASSHAVQGGFRVSYSTTDGSAVSTGSERDYIDTDGELTFLGTAGEVQSFFVEVIDEPNRIEPAIELFNVALGAITPLGRGVRVEDLIPPLTPLSVEIQNDPDLTANITLSPLNSDRYEGTGGTSTLFTFNVTLNIGVQGGFDLSYLTSDGTATTADGDYLDNDGILNFAGIEGETKTITVQVNQDAKIEQHETFQVALGSISGLDMGISADRVSIGSTPQTAIIRNDDQIYVTAAGPGGGPHLRVFNSTTNAEEMSFFAYDPGYTGGVRVASGDVNGDGVADILTGTGPGGGPHVKVFDGFTQEVLFSFFAYEAQFFGGFYLAAADLTGDGRAELIVSPDRGGGPHVKVFDLTQSTTQPLFDFFAFNPQYLGGVRVAVGDVNGDQTPDIIAASGLGGGSHVQVFSGTDQSMIRSFLPFPGFMGGVFVASADFNQDSFDDIVFSPGMGGGPHVRIISGESGDELSGGFVYPANFTGGVLVAVTDANGDTIPELVVSPGPGSESLVSVRNGQSQQVIHSFMPYPGFMGGVFVAGSLTPSLGAALQLAGHEPLPTQVDSLQQSDIPLLLEEASHRVEQAGFGSMEDLTNVTIRIVDLPGNQLGEAFGNTIWIDHNAAGFGWFIDSTPEDDIEFTRANPDVMGKVDLLTVLAHELGHVLGWSHDDWDENFMAERLALGTRSLNSTDERTLLEDIFGSDDLSELWFAND